MAWIYGLLVGRIVSELNNKNERPATKMKTIIAGCRTFTDYATAKQVLDKIQNITEIVSGAAEGADSLGERHAKENKIPLKQFPADWDTYKKAAGPLRNKEMAIYADVLIAFWDGKSKGTKNMIEQALSHDV